MSDTINLAGKNIIVDNVTTIGADTLASLRSIASQVVDNIKSRETAEQNSKDTISAVNKEFSKALCRIGARKSEARMIDIYAYDPKHDYSQDYGDDYYVETGYVNCDGANYPVWIPSKHETFNIPSSAVGVWALGIELGDVGDDPYSPIVMRPEPVGSIMRWYDNDDSQKSSVEGVWVFGQFTLSATDGIQNIIVSTEAIRPEAFLKSNFMQIMNDAKGSDSTDFTNWAVAMGCDQIFKRLAVLEAFINKLFVNNLEISGSGGFSVKILSKTSDTDSTPLYEVKYGGRSIFKIEPVSGDILFGNGFRYSYDTDQITASKAIITQGSTFEGDFNTDVLWTSKQEEQHTSFSAGGTVSQGSTLYNALKNAGLKRDVKYRCTLNGNSNVKYLIYGYSRTSSNNISYYVRFYDYLYNEIALSRIGATSQYSDKDYVYYYSTVIPMAVYGTYLTGGISFTVDSGGNFLKVLIPDQTDVSSLKAGQLYYDSTTGNVKVKMNSNGGLAE